jgi:hypothetical protein
MESKIIESKNIILDDILIEGILIDDGESFTIKYRKGDIPMIKIEEFVFNVYAEIKNDKNNNKCIYLLDYKKFGETILGFQFELDEIIYANTCPFYSKQNLLGKKFECLALEKEMIIFHFRQNKNGKITSKITKNGEEFCDELITKNIENESIISLILNPSFKIYRKKITMKLIIEQMDITTRTPISFDKYIYRFFTDDEQTHSDLMNEIHIVSENHKKLINEREKIEKKIYHSECDLFWLAKRINEISDKLKKK